MKIHFLTKTLSSLIILQSIIPYSGIVSAMVAVEPYPTTISCPQLNPPAPDLCPNGEWVQQDISINGCPKAPVCVVKIEPEEPTCPLYAMVMPTCSDNQTVISGEYDNNGCSLPPRCQDAIAITGSPIRVRQFDMIVDDYTPVTSSDISIEPILGDPVVLTPEPSFVSKSYIVEPTQGCQENKPCETILVKRLEDNIVVSDGNAMMSTSMPIQVENSMITITTEKGNNPVILPSLVKQIIETDFDTTGDLPIMIDSIELLPCTVGQNSSSEYSCSGHDAIYSVQSTKETKLFGLLPIMSTISYDVSASKGTILSTEKPWYLNIFSFLFTW